MSEKFSSFQVKVLSNVCQGMHRFYSEKVLCDLKVTVGHTTFDCHLLVLASVSRFFHSLLSSSWRENQTETVTIEHEDVTPETFQMLLDILYKAEDVITNATATDILRMSAFLQIEFLEQHCQEYLSANIAPEVCVGHWMFAEKYELSGLAQKASAMASDQIDLVVKSGEIVHLPKAMLLVILGSQTKLNMDDLCRTILRWVEEDADARQVHFGELLPFVSFPQLSPVYISELMKYFEYPFSKYLAKSISEAVSFNLQNQKPELQRQILAQQDRASTSSLIKKCAVVVGGCLPDNTVMKDLLAFYVEPGSNFSAYRLKPPPEPCGVTFATCVWKNELYVSRGNKTKTFLSKFVPGNNEWETLLALDFGLENHSMSAVNGVIYWIGTSCVHDQCSPGLLAYDVSTRKWTELKDRPELPVEDAATAVLGHRIYVFGGRDGSKKATDTVQCLDSMSGRVYVAGTLPMPSAELLALSDGGTIYVVCDGTRVLRMREHFDVADRRERQLKDKIGKEGHPSALAENSSSIPSVRFVEVGAFADAKILSAYLHNGNMVACGAVSSDGTLLTDVTSMNLTTGKVVTIRQGFNKRLKNFALHTLNIPQEFLNEETAILLLQPGDLVKMKLGSPLPEHYSNAEHYHYGARNQKRPHSRRVQCVSYECIGSVQSVDASGTVTVSFPNYDSYPTYVSQLCFPK